MKVNNLQDFEFKPIFKIQSFVINTHYVLPLIKPNDLIFYQDNYVSIFFLNALFVKCKRTNAEINVNFNIKSSINVFNGL